MMVQDPGRFAAEVAAMEGESPAEGSILMYGSSFFTKWGYDGPQNALNAAGRRARVINRGFGGTLVDDLLYYYHRLVRPLRPVAVILRSGVNDIANGLEPGEVLTLLQRLCGWISADLPSAGIWIMPIFDMKRTEWLNEHFLSRFAEYNRGCAQLAQDLPKAALLDINDFFYENAADIGTHTGMRDVFCEDGLHLTDAGYEAFAPYFAERLAREGLAR